ncbi:membrane fusion protein, multidrug efflux system [Shimia gijangensis]|uniref:Membrane fusion protein, multidrug efflux system n=1 Tax=Shimia gijangensis TaxID=1470563 RepID=A0A1M6SKC1_9RHOB|nr:efflux RND transporter periplasmic adaptor subunit [Shimia gijangensis]SHK45191.1 membrane fusion protein, multidrug efflux system [Shimia gijangensis]
MKSETMLFVANSVQWALQVSCFVAFAGAFGSARAQEASPPGVLVETLTPRTQAETDSFPGWVLASAKVDIVAQVNGIVTGIHFDEGWPVSEGDLLYTIDPAEYEAAVAGAEAALKAAKAAAELKRIEWDRKKQLFDKGTGTQSELQLATARYDQSKANVTASEVALEMAKIQLDRTTINAPLNGRMSIGHISVGALVGPNTGPLVTVVSSNPIKVGFLVPLGLYTAYLQEGRKLSDLKVSLVLPDNSTFPHTANIDFAAPVANSSTNSIVLRGVVANPDYLLIDQQSVEVVVSERNPSSTLTVPKTALLLDQIGTYVLVVGPDNVVEVARPDLGREFEQRMEILAGLDEGTQVIVAGHAKARVGQPVTPAEKE